MLIWFLILTDVFFSNCCWESSMFFYSFVQQHGNGKVLESALQHSKFVNQNGAKMVDAWNVKKLTEAWTKMEASKLRTKAAQWLSRYHQTKRGRMQKRPIAILISELIYWIWNMQYIICLFWFHARNQLDLTL